MKIEYNGRKYDLVKKWFKTPQETIDAFDFTVSMIAIDTNRVYVGETTFIDLSKRQLIINKITYPASTMSRAFRYYKKGYYMCQGEMKKIVESIQSMELTIEDDEEKKDEPPSGDILSDFFRGID